MKVSIIIPIYNGEKYIDRCLDSLINQTLKDIEIICINDGSKDNSLEILNNYAKKDNRIVVINQENSGVSIARNNGIKKASGEFIMFSDVDDTFKYNACEIAYLRIKKKEADVLVFGANIVINGKIVSSVNNKLIDKVINNNDTYYDLINLNIVVWDKIFRTKFVKDNNIFFPEGFKLSEDGIFCLLCLFNNAKYDFLNSILYNHVDFIENSATSNVKYGIKEDLKAFKYLISLPIYQKQNEEIKKAIVDKFCRGAIFYWERLIDENYREEYYTNILELIEYLKSLYSEKYLNSLKGYKKLVKVILKYKKKFPYNIYCKEKFKNFDIINFLGIKIKKIKKV